MGKLHKLVIRKYSVAECLYFFSRLCVYSYGLIYMLHSVVSFPNRLDAVLRFGIGFCGIIGALCDSRYSVRSVRISRFFKWYGILLIISIVAGMYSPNVNWNIFTKNILDILFLGTGFSFSVHSENEIKLFLRGFMLCGVVMFLFLSKNNMLFIDDRLGRSLTGDNTNTFALYILLTLVAAIGTFYLSDQKKDKIFSLICILCDLYMLFLSGGRKYVIAPIILLAVLVVFNTSNKNNQIKKLVTFILLTIGIMAGWKLITTNSLFYNTIGYRFIQKTSMKGREDYIVRGIGFFLESPIWGHGENSFAYLISSYTGYQIYSHNNYIELLTNFGLIGFLWFYVYYFKVIFVNFHNYKITLNKICLFFVAVMVSFLFLDIGTVSYCDSSLTFVFWIMAFNVEILIGRMIYEV